MNTLVKQYAVQFTSDGESTAVVFDCSLTPIREDFRGNVPNAVLAVPGLPIASSVATGAIQPCTLTLQGTTVTLTLPTPQPQYDDNDNLILYTCNFLLQFPD